MTLCHSLPSVCWGHVRSPSVQHRSLVLDTKVRALLAYLAVEAHAPYRREALSALLWPDQSPKLARQSLRQIEIEPYREEAHQQLMRILARSGQRSAALAQYEKCRRILAQELGLEPAQETRALYEHIRSAGDVVNHGRHQQFQHVLFVVQVVQREHVYLLLEKRQQAFLTRKPRR